MTFIIRNSDRTIKTFAERVDDFILAPGETIDSSPLSFAEYAARLSLSVNGRTGVIIRVASGAPAVVVDVSCPGESEVDLDVNGLPESLQLVDGKAQLILSTETPGVFIIQPADRTVYAPAGNSFLTVEVTL